MKYRNGFSPSNFLFNLHLFIEHWEYALMAGSTDYNELRKQVSTDVHLLKRCLPEATQLSAHRGFTWASGTLSALKHPGPWENSKYNNNWQGPEFYSPVTFFIGRILFCCRSLLISFHLTDEESSLVTCPMTFRQWVGRHDQYMHVDLSPPQIPGCFCFYRVIFSMWKDLSNIHL